MSPGFVVEPAWGMVVVSADDEGDRELVADSAIDHLLFVIFKEFQLIKATLARAGK